MLMTRPTSSTHQHPAPMMIPDRYGTVPPHAPGTTQARYRLIASSTSNGSLSHSGSSPRRQPRLGRPPPPTAVLTSEHHPPPALDDVAEVPEAPGRPRRVQRLVQVLLEPDPVGVRQGGTDLLDPLGQVRTGRRLSTAHAMVPRVQPSLAPMTVTEPAGRACMAVLVAARHGHHRATGLTQSRRSRFADGDSAGIPPNTIQHSVTGTTLPRPGRCCTRCIAVLHWISRALRKVTRGRR
jgi:hypothetical protein